MKAYIKFSAFIILSLLSFVVIPQQSDDIMVSSGGDTLVIKPITLLEISPKIGDFNTNLKTYKNELKTHQEIYEIDTSLNRAKEYLGNEKLSLTENVDNLTLVKIENARREWGGYEKILNDWESKVTDRITSIESTLFKVQFSKKTWETTKKSAKEQAIPQESLVRINETLSAAKNIEKALKSKQDSVINIQNKITDFKIVVGDVLSSLDEHRKNLQSEYFIQDSPPLWKASDSTIIFSNAKSQFKNSLEEHTQAIEVFASTNDSNLIFHLILFIFLIILFYSLNNDFKKQELPEDQKKEQVKYFLSRYIISAFLLALSFTQLIYSGVPTAIRELMFILLFIPTVILYSGLIPKKLKPLLLSIVILYIFSEIHIFFTAKTLITRILLILQDSLYIYVMIKLGKTDNSLGDVYKGGWHKAIIRGTNILIFFSIISILSNLIGYVNLSLILSNTLINILIVPITLSLLVYIFNALFVSLFKTQLFQHSNIIKSQGDLITKKLHTYIIYFAVFIWLRSIFISLGLAEEAGDWLLGLMNNEWKVGSVNISFGGVIAFFLVILITTIVTRGVKYLLEDEIFPRFKMGRGVPGAISMIVRYTLVAFGIYVALSAAGVDLGQFGLIAGALGVGIGFGLQSVVFNFIAGLILAFERPIQKGDTIEVGTLIGDVMDIGVRASTIRTYDGADVIIPNGNLISNDLINWTFSDRVKRRDIKVGVAYGTDPHKVMELLFKVASENENVLPLPKPWPLFEGFGDSSLKFSLRFWVNFDSGMTVKSQVAMSIYDALAEAGIQIPFPQTDLHVKSFDPTIQKTVFPFSKELSKKPATKKPGRTKKQEDPE